MAARYSCRKLSTDVIPTMPSTMSASSHCRSTSETVAATTRMRTSGEVKRASSRFTQAVSRPRETLFGPNSARRAATSPRFSPVAALSPASSSPSDCAQYADAVFSVDAFTLIRGCRLLVLRSLLETPYSLTSTQRCCGLRSATTALVHRRLHCTWPRQRRSPTGMTAALRRAWGIAHSGNLRRRKRIFLADGMAWSRSSTITRDRTIDAALRAGQDIGRNPSRTLRTPRRPQVDLDQRASPWAVAARTWIRWRCRVAGPLT